MKIILLIATVFITYFSCAQMSVSENQEYDILLTNEDGDMHVLRTKKKVFVKLTDHPDEKLRGYLSVVDSTHIMISNGGEFILDISEISQLEAKHKRYSKLGGVLLSIPLTGAVVGATGLAFSNSSAGFRVALVGVTVAVATVPLLFVGIALMSHRKKYDLQEEWTLSIVPKVD
ncbi:MAG: hypothetical protein ACI837_000487 [Crocinitomicaceae bacterium]|jgi:hypothetical protein